MKKYLSTLIIACTIGSSTHAFADTSETCNAYRLEIIKLKTLLDQRYSGQRAILMDKDSDVADRSALIRAYTLDADNLRFRMLIDKFRADRRNECGWWSESDGKFN